MHHYTAMHFMPRTTIFNACKFVINKVRTMNDRIKLLVVSAEQTGPHLAMPRPYAMAEKERLRIDSQGPMQSSLSPLRCFEPARANPN